MFSDRVPADLVPNRLTQAIAERRREGREFVDLTESNPTRVGFDYPADLLAPLADARGLEYRPEPFGAVPARAAIADDYRRRGVAVAADRVVLTTSTSEAYSLLFKLLANAGDDVLVPRPSYPLLDHLARLDIVNVHPYELEYHGRWSIDLDSVSRALTTSTRAVLIVSPNNPTGSFVSREDLDRLARICGERGVAIVADEVFADYELEPGAASRAGRVAVRDDVLGFTLGGLSKSVGLPQVKLGWIVVSGLEPIVGDALRRLELVCDTYLSVSTPVQLAAADWLGRGAAIRVQIIERVRANHRELLRQAVSAPSCRVLCSEGGWYAVLQVPSYQSEETLVLSLLANDDVLTHPGYFYDFPRESFLVVSLLPPVQTFRDGIARVLRHFTCTDRS